jgi:hypothetical protein
LSCGCFFTQKFFHVKHLNGKTQKVITKHWWDIWCIFKLQECKKRGLKVVVAGIPKTIDNDIEIIDKSFGFDTAVEEAQRAINAAHVEAESTHNGVGLVKLMGRYSGYIAMHATLASRDVVGSAFPNLEVVLQFYVFSSGLSAVGSKTLQ